MPQDKKSIQDFQKQAELDFLFSGKSSNSSSNLVRSMQTERQFKSQPQGGSLISLTPTSPVDLVMETILTGISESGRANPLAVMAGAIATGKYGGKIASNVGRKGVGRVLTQLYPFGYENKLPELAELLTTKRGLKSILKDRNQYIFSESGKDFAAAAREMPFRRMFGLKPRQGLGGVYKKNKDGTFAFDIRHPAGEYAESEVRRDILGGNSLNHNVMGGYSAKDSPAIVDGVPAIERRYKDVWDFKLNKGERVLDPDRLFNIQRFLVDKITKPVTIKGKVNTVKLLDDMYDQREYYNRLLHRVATNQKIDVPSVKWWESVIKNPAGKGAAKKLVKGLGIRLQIQARGAAPFGIDKKSRKYRMYKNLRKAFGEI